MTGFEQLYERLTETKGAQLERERARVMDVNLNKERFHLDRIE
jgi:hypothetical protein